ncbi:acyl-ACP desaturase [Williamsia sp. SKLECPSW1]
MTDNADDDLILVLEKALPELTEEHERASITWNPHDLVPWDEGRNYAFLGGTDWDASDSTMPEATRVAVLALLLTKDNLPSFHRILGVNFPPFSEWRALVGRWTAEDNRHSIALRDHLIVTRAVDPEWLESLRLSHVTHGYEQNERSRSMSPAGCLAVMAVHENLSTWFASRLAEDVESESLAGILRNVATDDAVQAQTFANFLDAALTAQPDATVVAVEEAFALNHPIGSDIADLADKVDQIPESYVGAEPFRRAAQALVDTLGLRTLDGLSEEAEAARQKVLARAEG